VGDYFVVCGDAANVANCDLDVSPDSNLVQNGAPDGVGLLHNGTLVDAVSYEGDTGVPYTEGSGAGLTDSSSLDLVGISRFPDGVDTDQNNVDFSLRCSTPGAANVAETGDCVAPNTDLVINEIDYDQPGTDTAEFVEIRNNGDVPADLTGWTLEFINGNGATVYDTINLPAISLASGDYFVVCANAATVANCDLDDSPNTNFIQNGSPDAVTLSFNATLIDTVSYEGDTGAPYTEGSGAGLEDASDGSISRCDDGVDTNQNNVDFLFTGTSTPGAANNCAPPPPPSSCGLPFTPIYVIQGNSTASPLAGTVVDVEGIVTGDFQNGKSGFHIQDADGDGDAATSDGIFIYASTPDVNVGDLVRVTGQVKEYYDLTEISASDLEVCSTGNSVAATPISLPVADLEAYEGMLVTFTDSLYISEYYNFARYGELVLSTERQFQPTATFDPGSVDSAQMLANNLLNRIKLDDGRGSQNPDPALHPDGMSFDMSNLFRGGDILNGVTGIVDYDFGEYKIQPTVGATHVEANPRSAAPDETGGSLKVASFNVLNYFTTLGSRGADTPEEFTRQRAKIVAALAAIDADVVGLIEIENNTDAIQNLVDGLNDAVGAGTYAYVDTGMIGTDEIKVAFIYKTATVDLVGDYAVLDSSVDSRFIDTKNRPALAQTFMDSNTGGVFTAVVNHLKSKGSSCESLGDPDLGDGAGNCNLTRTAAAEALVDWLATDPTNSGDADFLIMGDLNAYDKEDPIDAIIAGGYSDLVYQYLGENAYSYVFDGQLGYLDHALANADLTEELTGVTIWHINADEASLIDYDMTFKQDAQDALYEADAYRSSDHDPVVIGMNICDEVAPTLEITLSHESLWPANHKYVDVTATVLATDNFDVAPSVELLSVTSSEADNGLGDGDTADDIVIVDDYTFQLRAERSGQNGEGRTYTITYQVTDACGNSTIGTATVFVPFSQKKK